MTGHDGDKDTRCAIEWKFSLHYMHYTHQGNLIIRFLLCKMGTLDNVPSTLEKIPFGFDVTVVGYRRQQIRAEKEFCRDTRTHCVPIFI